jgi:asparagine synthetase B (glutamine-hydrolysing)
VLGTCGGTADGTLVHKGNASITVADARLDAWVDRPRPPFNELSLRRSASVLDAVLGRGAAMLNALAGDFVAARWEPKSRTLSLVRDAFGMRPIFWARRGSRMAFASDIEVLVRLGVADGALDRTTVARWLSMLECGGPSTAFSGVARILGGEVSTFEGERAPTSQRWFRPQDIEANQDIGPVEHADLVRTAIFDSLRDRIGGKKGTLLLSGGRDSGALAIAAAESGFELDCVTKTFDRLPGLDSPRADGERARKLADALGHAWRSVPAPQQMSPEDFARMPRLTRTPLSTLGLSTFVAASDVISTLDGPRVIFEGEGGDDLFGAHHIVLLDLLKRGRPTRAITAMKGIRAAYQRPYRTLLRSTLRGLVPIATPAPIQRMRGPVVFARPPWIVGPDVRALAGGPYLSTRQVQINTLLDSGEDWWAELSQMWARGIGQEYAAPLLDMRVTRAALSGPLLANAPDPGLKPVLRRAVLRTHDSSRVKTDFTPYIDLMSASCVRDCPSYTVNATAACDAGLVARSHLASTFEPRWARYALCLGLIEGWLRHGFTSEEHNGTKT